MRVSKTLIGVIVGSIGTRYMKYIIAYHVTRKDRIKGILKKGIGYGRSMYELAGKYVYLTDEEGAEVVAKYWITCEKVPVIIKVRFPEKWLFSVGGREALYGKKYIALEWKSKKAIPTECIIEIYEYEGC